MSEAPIIFVSHSSKDNEFTRQMCRALRGEGGGQAGCELVVDYEKLQNYDVLVDVDELQTGKPWPKQLHEWMARCHAAVLLLTSHAVKSRWVLKEATILAWRLSLDKNFRFFTVRFNDVSPADLTAHGFDPLMLPEIQTLVCGDAATIAEQVRKAVPPPADQTPYDSLRGALEDLAQDIKENTLKKMAEEMGVKSPQWQPDVDKKQKYVQAIAVKLLSEDLGGLDKLVDTLKATTPNETVKKILNILAPHWVDAEAAGRLPSLAKCQPRRAVAMNGAVVPEFTAEMYVRRAYPLSVRQWVVPIPGGNSGDMVDHVTRELYDWYLRQVKKRSEAGGAALNVQQKTAVIEYFGKGEPRHFVVLSAPHPSEADLKRLMTDFPKLTFILWTGEELLDPKLEEVVCLKPPVDLTQEEDQRDAYEEAMLIIDR